MVACLGANHSEGQPIPWEDRQLDRLLPTHLHGPAVMDGPRSTSPKLTT